MCTIQIPFHSTLENITALCVRALAYNFFDRIIEDQLQLPDGEYTEAMS